MFYHPLSKIHFVIYDIRISKTKSAVNVSRSDWECNRFRGNTTNLKKIRDVEIFVRWSESFGKERPITYRMRQKYHNN